MNKKKNTIEKSYTKRLILLENVWWKKFFNVQLPYKWHLQKLKPKFMLDVGCGIGRNLRFNKGIGVGIDHNPFSIEVCKKEGLQAFTTADFRTCKFYKPDTFDTLLLSHILEHLNEEEIYQIIQEYLPLIKHGGQIIFITPQEAGFLSDSTHIKFTDFKRIKMLLKPFPLKLSKKYSYPFPRCFGKFFCYNEFVTVLKK